MKNISSDEKIQNDVELFNKEVAKYRKEKDKLVNDFNTLKENKLDEFLKKLSQLVKNYMNSNNIDFVIDKNHLFLGNANNDISEDILALINKKYY